MDAVDQDNSVQPLQEWVQRLSEEEMPIFAQTVGEINRMLATEEYSSLALSRVILQDPSMTAKVVKLANSVFYNPGGVPISTVSRAVVVLGFNAVQAICISILVIETMVKGRAKERVMRELARSIHGATQARGLYPGKDAAGEEIFVAALLSNLGQMAFWCFAGEQGNQLDEALRTEPGDPGTVEQQVLGFRLKNLTAALVEEWHLSPLVSEGIKGKASKDPRAKFIDLGHRIARQAEEGWNGPEVRVLAQEASRLLGKPVSEVGEQLQALANEAVQRAKSMGANHAAKLIPLAEKTDGESDSSWDSVEAPTWLEPDPMLQLKILREITITLGTKPELNVLLEMVLEGIHRGVGMDRTVLALITPRRNLVKSKLVLGSNRMRFQDRFQFELGVKPANIFCRLMAGQEAILVTHYDDPQFKGTLFGGIFEVIDRAPFMAQPVLFGGNAIGMYYADRFPSGRAIDQETFESFKLFVQQANQGLAQIAKARLAG
ncbi:MAG: HDOD domain-containing protein [Fibrobacteria bacterium]|nr:HDOD domain-containing protein [Fibrobacteria bacterium]